MLRARDFRLFSIQATIYTPGASVQSARILAHLVNHWPDRFANVVLASDLPSGMPAEVPCVIVQDAASQFRAQVSPARFDLVWTGQEPNESMDLAVHLAWCCEVFERYRDAMQARTDRLACVLRRINESPSPATELARHFCRPEWMSATGPINRPSDFQLHSAKQYIFNGFPVNSWVKAMTAAITFPNQPAAIPTEQNVVLVDQDINTRVSPDNPTPIADERIRAYFVGIPEEFTRIMALYFPDVNDE